MDNTFCNECTYEASVTNCTSGTDMFSSLGAVLFYLAVTYTVGRVQLKRDGTR